MVVKDIFTYSNTVTCFKIIAFSGHLFNLKKTFVVNYLPHLELLRITSMHVVELQQVKIGKHCIAFSILPFKTE